MRLDDLDYRLGLECLNGLREGDVVATTKPIDDGPSMVHAAGDHLNAERFLDEHGADVRYSPELARWFVWNGSWWDEDRLELTQELARATIDGLRSWVSDAPTGEMWKQRSRHYEQSTRSGRRDGLLAIARTDRKVAVAVDELDRHAHLLACRNGTVNLRSGELELADRSLLLTRGLTVDYRQEARSDAWDAFLSRTFAGNRDTIGYVRRLMGYAVTGEVAEHVLPIFYGTGANAKSTIITAFTTLLGQHASVAPEGLLTETKHEQHPERLAALRGRRLVVSSELERRATLAEGLIKSITGGDRISARFLYGQRFDFLPTHTIVLVTNHMPRVRGTDEAIWRRLRMVPFTTTIPPADRIPDYGQRLATEHGEAILAWLVAGAVDWYAGGLVEAEQVRRATLEYRKREDVFSRFLEERTTAIDGRTRIKHLRESWKAWARNAGAGVGRDQDFTEWLQVRGHAVETYQGAKFVCGVGIIAGDDDPVRPREASPETSPSAHARGKSPARPHEVSPNPDQSLFGDDRDFWSRPEADRWLATFGDADEASP